MERVSQRLVPALVALLGAAGLSYFWWGHWGDASGAVWLASGIALAGAALGAVVPPRAARLHTAIAAALMLVLAGFAASRALGRWPFRWDALPDRRYAGFIALLDVAIAVGLLRGAFWARWAAMALAAGSALGGALNSFGMRGARDETAWLAAIGVVGGATLWSQLRRPSVRAHFARSAEHALWSSRDRLVRCARWAAVANFAAAPMLVLYALGQPVAPRTVVSALVLAPILFLGGALVAARRAAGVVVLGIAGVALAAHTAATAEYVTAANLPVAGYYAAFWLPAAALGMIAGALAIGRACRSR